MALLQTISKVVAAGNVIALDDNDVMHVGILT